MAFDNGLDEHDANGLEQAALDEVVVCQGKMSLIEDCD